MRRAALWIGLVLTMVPFTVGVSAQSAPPAKSLKMLMGTWKLSQVKSRFDNFLPPKSMVRTYQDLGNGSYSFTQVVTNLGGYTSETRYVGKDDGTESDVFRIGADGKPVRVGTVRIAWISDYKAEQVDTTPETVPTCTREITRDGTLLSVTWGTPVDLFNGPHSPDPSPDVLVFERQ